MALIHCDFFSEVLQVCTSATVILPQATNGQIGMSGAAGDGRHRTLWLLHGMSDDHTIWQRRTSIERYVAPLGLAVVMPRVERSFYADMHQGPRFWTFISEELPRLCRSFFPLSDRREDNFVAGLSMGGYGAFKLGLRCPDQFAAAASLSGAVDIGHTMRAVDANRDAEWVRIFGPLDQLAGSEHDLFGAASDLAASGRPRPRLFQWCGTDDFLYQGNLLFRDHVAPLGYDFTYEEGPGGHSWDMWDAQIQRVLEWLELVTR